MRDTAEVIALFLFIVLVVGAILVYLLGPSVIDVSGLAEEWPLHPYEAQRYYDLKNLSCEIISGDFLIVTHDVTEGEVRGVPEQLPEEKQAAQLIVESYDYNQTTKTYIHGDWKKKVEIVNGEEYTTIWKENRVYTCKDGCTMRLMTDEESEDYYSDLREMKYNCRYFGKTPLPYWVDLNTLFEINYTGDLVVNDYTCENFLISGNKTYARELLANETLGEEQRALLWAIAHFEGPVQECLGKGTGIIVYRNLTLDLTKSYRFHYLEDGYMFINQQTTLTYFTDKVPASFLALPE